MRLAQGNWTFVSSGWDLLCQRTVTVDRERNP
jgi:hypothetical protein